MESLRKEFFGNFITSDDKDVDTKSLGKIFKLNILEQDFGDAKNFNKQLPGSPRAQGIKKRSRKSSTDGRVLDEHDQFYRDHKLLLKLFQVLGVMPIMRGEIGKITFSWKSIATIYAICLYCFTTVLVLLVGRERVYILTSVSTQFDEYIYSIIFVIFLVPHFWVPFVGWGVANEVKVYKNSWGTFQVHYYRVTGGALEFPRLKILIVIISLGCLILAIGFLLSLSALLAGFTLYHTTAYLHIITMINMNCALWYINCRGVVDASRALANSFQRDIDRHCTAYIIEHYRFLWLELSSILQKMGNAYARTYSSYTLFLFINITIAVYGFMSEIMDHGFGFSFKECGLMVDTAYCLALLFIFCNCSYNASGAIANRIRDTLLSIDLSKIDVVTTREIHMFLKAIKMNPPIVSLKGYGSVNREYFTSNLTSMAIYLIVLLQFKISFSSSSGHSAKGGA